MTATVFDKLVAGEIPCWKVWEDDEYLAFLTPSPNTVGVTVVIPKRNEGDYVFALGEQQFYGLMAAARTVARILERAFEIPRVALVFEGTGIPHVHAKLYPLHGRLGTQTDVWSEEQQFSPEYLGYLTTVEGPPMSEEELNSVRDRIRRAAAEQQGG